MDMGTGPQHVLWRQLSSQIGPIQTAPVSIHIHTNFSQIVSESRPLSARYMKHQKSPHAGAGGRRRRAAQAGGAGAGGAGGQV